MYETGSSREIFLRRPLVLKADVAWPMTRQKGAKKLIGTCLSHDTVGAYLHYFRQRSTPHYNDDRCEACKKGYPFRYYGYVAAVIGDNDEKAIVEITDAGMVGVDAAFCKFRTLRGLSFQLQRTNLRSNGKMHVSFAESKRKKDQLPEAPDVIRMLMNMWEVPEIFQIEVANEMALDRLKGTNGHVNVRTQF